MEILKFVGNRIKELRTSFGGSGISQEALAEALKVSPNTVSRWETATYKPGLKDLDALATYFAVSISDFFPNPQVDTKVEALLRAAKELPTEDVEVLRQFAELKRAERLLKNKRA